MRVYIVSEYADYEGSDIVAVCSTLRRARKIFDNCKLGDGVTLRSYKVNTVVEDTTGGSNIIDTRRNRRA